MAHSHTPGGHRSALLLALVLAASCANHDNSGDTDKASKDLREAQSKVSKERDSLTTGSDQSERHKREILKEQQALADNEAALEQHRQQLGSAQGTLTEARLTYGAAVKQRFAKLDAALAGLATRTDASSKDAMAGLRARRDLLATRIEAMPAAADSGWVAYTKDVDTTFDAIERDLNSATD